MIRLWSLCTTAHNCAGAQAAGFASQKRYFSPVSLQYVIELMRKALFPLFQYLKHFFVPLKYIVDAVL